MTVLRHIKHALRLLQVWDAPQDLAVSEIDGDDCIRSKCCNEDYLVLQIDGKVVDPSVYVWQRNGAYKFKWRRRIRAKTRYSKHQGYQKREANSHGKDLFQVHSHKSLRFLTEFKLKGARNPATAGLHWF
jgi:hypothetical protein